MGVTGTIRLFEPGCLGPLSLSELTFETRGDRVMLSAKHGSNREGYVRGARKVRLDAARSYVERVLSLVQAHHASAPARQPVARPPGPLPPPPVMSPRLTFQLVLEEPRAVTEQFPVDTPRGEALREYVLHTIREVASGS